jgi:hypothetical protein
VWVEREVTHLRRGHHEADLIASLIELGLDAQAGGRPRVADQLDEGLEGAEWRIDATAKAGVSWSRPTLTQASLRALS